MYNIITIYMTLELGVIRTGARQSDENQLRLVNLTKNMVLPVNLPKPYLGQG